jgi:hypothetical protein
MRKILTAESTENTERKNLEIKKQKNKPQRARRDMKELIY